MRLRLNTSGTLYVDPHSNAAKYLAAHPGASWLNQIASTAQAFWLGDSAAEKYASHVLSQAPIDQIVVFVIYFIMKRDETGRESRGGALDLNEYKSFIDRVANAIGDRRTVCIIEPDALADDLGNPAAHAERVSGLRYAIDSLSALKETDTYLDCGHAGWPNNPSQIRSQLIQHGLLANATGIALNVSNHRGNAETLVRARELLDFQSDLDELPLIIDTSRNGKDAHDQWQNNPMAGLGAEPTLQCDGWHANLWIKRPGESDGREGSNCSAGEFDPILAQRLQNNAQNTATADHRLC
jgi:endoglucanase